jgi:putative transposase
MDWFSRKVLAWRLSITIDSGFCVDALEEALTRYGRPEIFNTDRRCPEALEGGSQFTSEAFTRLREGHGIRISMDGKGSRTDNVFIERLWKSVKYE